MFWIAFLGLAFSSMLIKLGFLSATVGILSFVVKLLVLALFAGLVAGAWLWFSKQTAHSDCQN